jgi:hypothetical protein
MHPLHDYVAKQLAGSPAPSGTAKKSKKGKAHA